MPDNAYVETLRTLQGEVQAALRSEEETCLTALRGLTLVDQLLALLLAEHARTDRDGRTRGEDDAGL